MVKFILNVCKQGKVEYCENKGMDICTIVKTIMREKIKDGRTIKWMGELTLAMEK